jgi:dihydrofolate reductase
MRKLIVSSLVSLDGIHGDPQSWVGDFFDEQAVEESLAALLDSDAMLMGRNTYDYFAPSGRRLQGHTWSGSTRYASTSSPPP